MIFSEVDVLKLWLMNWLFNYLIVRNSSNLCLFHYQWSYLKREFASDLNLFLCLSVFFSLLRSSVSLGWRQRFKEPFKSNGKVGNSCPLQNSSQLLVSDAHSCFQSSLLSVQHQLKQYHLSGAQDARNLYLSLPLFSTMVVKAGSSLASSSGVGEKVARGWGGEWEIETEGNLLSNGKLDEKSDYSIGEPMECPMTIPSASVGERVSQ